jgi:hypothetical protein
MSAYEVSTVHIDALLTAALHQFGGSAYEPVTWFEHAPTDENWATGQAPSRYTLTRENAGLVGAMLLAENRKSVNFRYSDDDLEAVYEFHPMAGDVKPVTILNAIRCYTYQSCETPGWMASQAHQFVEALQGKMIRRLCRDDETWEITDRDAFKTTSSAR